MPLHEYEDLKEIEKKYKKNNGFLYVELYNTGYRINDIQGEYIFKLKLKSDEIDKETSDLVELINSKIMHYVDLIGKHKMQRDNEFLLKSELYVNYKVLSELNEKLQAKHNKIPKWIRNLFA